jgi:ABC-type Fe3+-hydroxamate transport system substrate-binding protein
MKSRGIDVFVVDFYNSGYRETAKRLRLKKQIFGREERANRALSY